MYNLNREKVYIASPYTNGNKKENVTRQIYAAEILFKAGFVPFIPLLGHYADHYLNLGEGTWFKWDLKWLETCDFLIRIRVFDDNDNEIPSGGADLEVEKALELKMPVYIFNSLENIEEWCESTKNLDGYKYR